MFKVTTSIANTLYPVVKMTSKGLWLSARYFRSTTQHNGQIYLFSALRHFMLTQNHAASEAVFERHAPFYERNSDHFIESHQ